MANTRCTAARREPFLAVCAFRICLERLSFSLGCIPSQSANLRGSKCDGSLNGSIESSIACLLHGCSKRICALASVRPCMRPRSSCQPDFGSRRQPSLISKKAARRRASVRLIKKAATCSRLSSPLPAQERGLHTRPVVQATSADLDIGKDSVRFPIAQSATADWQFRQQLLFVNKTALVSHAVFSHVKTGPRRSADARKIIPFTIHATETLCEPRQARV